MGGKGTLAYRVDWLVRNAGLLGHCHAGQGHGRGGNNVLHLASFLPIQLGLARSQALDCQESRSLGAGKKAQGEKLSSRATLHA